LSQRSIRLIFKMDRKFRSPLSNSSFLPATVVCSTILCFCDGDAYPASPSYKLLHSVMVQLMSLNRHCALPPSSSLLSLFPPPTVTEFDFYVLHHPPQIHSSHDGVRLL